MSRIFGSSGSKIIPSVLNSTNPVPQILYKSTIPTAARRLQAKDLHIPKYATLAQIHYPDFVQRLRELNPEQQQELSQQIAYEALKLMIRETLGHEQSKEVFHKRRGPQERNPEVQREWHRLFQEGLGYWKAVVRRREKVEAAERAVEKWRRNAQERRKG